MFFILRCFPSLITKGESRSWAPDPIHYLQDIGQKSLPSLPALKDLETTDWIYRLSCSERREFGGTLQVPCHPFINDLFFPPLWILCWTFRKDPWPEGPCNPVLPGAWGIRGHVCSVLGGEPAFSTCMLTSPDAGRAVRMWVGSKSGVSSV